MNVLEALLGNSPPPTKPRPMPPAAVPAKQQPPVAAEKPPPAAATASIVSVAPRREPEPQPASVSREESPAPEAAAPEAAAPSPAASPSPVRAFVPKILKGSTAPQHIQAAFNRSSIFYTNAKKSNEEGDYFTAMINYALTLNTLGIVKDFSEDGGSNYEIPAALCDGDRDCTLDTLLDRIHRTTECLRTKIVEIRSTAIEDPVAAPPPKKEEESPKKRDPDDDAAPVKVSKAEGGANLPTGKSSVVVKDDETKAFVIPVMKWTEGLCKKNCFSRIIGQADVKEKMRTSFIMPLMFPNMFGKTGKGMLLYGMPGTGKTAFVRALVTEVINTSNDAVDVILLTPEGQDLKSKYFGEAEEKIKQLFTAANRLACDANVIVNQGDGQASVIKRRAISIVFIDEIDSIAQKRSGGGGGDANSSTVNALLQQMDGISSHTNVVVIGATNYPWRIDTAIKRRLSNQVHIKLPSETDIEKLLYMKFNELVRDVVTRGDLASECSSSSSDNNNAAGSEEKGQRCTKAQYNLCNIGENEDLWKTQAKVYFEPMMKNPEYVRTVAKLLYGKHYSPADVNIFFDNYLKRNGELAFNNTIFIVGPRMSASSDDRGFVSLSMMASLSPWEPIEAIKKKIIDHEKSITPTAAASGMIGELIHIPNPIKQTKVGIDHVVINGKKYRNIHWTDEAMKGISFKYTPYDAFDPFDEVYVEVDDNNVQQDNVLFQIWFDVLQGDVTFDKTGKPLDQPANTLPVCATFKDAFSYIAETSKQQASFGTTPLSSIACPGQHDYQYLFLLTNVATLGEIYKSIRVEKTTSMLRSIGSTLTLGFISPTASEKLAENTNEEELSKKTNEELFKDSLLKKLIENKTTQYFTVINGVEIIPIESGKFSAGYDAGNFNTKITNNPNFTEAGDATLSVLEIIDHLIELDDGDNVIHTGSIYSAEGNLFCIIFGMASPTAVNKSNKIYLTDMSKHFSSVDKKAFDIGRNAHFLNWALNPSLMHEMAKEAKVSISYTDQDNELMRKYENDEPIPDEQANGGK